MTMTTNDDRFTTHDESDDDLAEAAREAELARASFSASVRTASASGVHAVKRVAERAKPFLIGALILGGAAVLVAAARLAQRPRRLDWLAPPRKPGFFGAFVKTAATRLLMLGLAHVTQKYLGPHGEEPDPLPAAGVPR
jgi:hypothetical protein